MPIQRKEYLTLKEAAEYLGIKRVSLYYYIKSLELKPEKFEHNKNAFLLMADVERIKQIKEAPWEAKRQPKTEEPPPEPQQAEHRIKPVKPIASLPEEKSRVSDSAQSRKLDIKTPGWEY